MVRASRKGHPISTLKRRLEFIEYLKTVGEGPECITWPWSRSLRYPSTVDETGRQVSAHRWVYEKTIGPLNGLETAHICDSPPCVRPSHLRAWSHGDNMRDAYRKGRKKANSKPRPGVLHHNARLAEGEVYAIRRLADQGVPHSTVSQSFGVSRACVTRIHTRTLWKHLPEESI